jgi:hypothetical protein
MQFYIEWSALRLSEEFNCDVFPPSTTTVQMEAIWRVLRNAQISWSKTE